MMLGGMDAAKLAVGCLGYNRLRLGAHDGGGGSWVCWDGMMVPRAVGWWELGSWFEGAENGFDRGREIQCQFIEMWTHDERFGCQW